MGTDGLCSTLGEGEEDVYFQVYVEVQAGPNDETDYHRRYFDAPPDGFNVIKASWAKLRVHGPSISTMVKLILDT